MSDVCCGCIHPNQLRVAATHLVWLCIQQATRLTLPGLSLGFQVDKYCRGMAEGYVTRLQEKHCRYFQPGGPCPHAEAMFTYNVQSAISLNMSSHQSNDLPDMATFILLYIQGEIFLNQ